MKKLLLFAMVSALTFGLLASCGESKKEEPADEPEAQEKIEQAEEMGEAEAPKEAEEETELGEAPKAEEPKAEKQEKKAVDYSKTPLKCKVVSLNDVAKGSNRTLDERRAKKYLEIGNPLLAKAENGKVYFVYTAGGALANSQLAKHASSEWIGIKGKTKRKFGLNIIIADEIKPMN